MLPRWEGYHSWAFRYRHKKYTINKKKEKGGEPFSFLHLYGGCGTPHLISRWLSQHNVHFEGTGTYTNKKLLWHPKVCSSYFVFCLICYRPFALST